MVIVNYNGDHFVTWLRYYPIYASHAISATRIAGDQWHKALSKTRMVRRIKLKLPENPFGSETQVVVTPRPITVEERDYTSADIQTADVSLADALQLYNPTHLDSKGISDMPQMTHTRSMEIP